MVFFVMTFKLKKYPKQNYVFRKLKYSAPKQYFQCLQGLQFILSLCEYNMNFHISAWAFPLCLYPINTKISSIFLPQILIYAIFFLQKINFSTDKK